MCAGNERVQPFDPMGEPMFRQEIQRPIRNRWLRAEPFVSERVENFIGSKRAVLFQQDLQHPPTHGRQLQPGLLAIGIGRGNPVRDARIMVVPVKSNRIQEGRTFFDSSRFLRLACAQ